MRNLKPPFQFDLRTLIEEGRRRMRTHVGDVAINLPFVSFTVKPEDPEKEAAKEIVIRMADRRVLHDLFRRDVAKRLDLLARVVGGGG